MSEVKLIAHRGNTKGPDRDRENSPKYLLEAIALGFDVEVDVWVVDDEFYLGHDEPDYIVDLEFLYKIRDKAWYHCKNIEALGFFAWAETEYKYFWHQTDDYTLTSTGHIWVYPNRPYTSDSIVVNLNEKYEYKKGEVFAACVDYV